MRLTGADISVFSINGTSFLAHLTGADVLAGTQYADSTPAVFAGRVRTPVKHHVEIRSALLSSTGSGARMSHLHVQSLKFGGLELRGDVLGFDFEGSIQMQETSGLADEWSWPVAVHKDYRAQLALAVNPLQVELPEKAFGHLAGQSGELVLLVDGEAITLNMVIAGLEHRAKAGSVQTYSLNLLGSASPSGGYPISPTGSGSLMAHAFNQAGTPLGIAALSYSGAFLVKSFGIRTCSGSLIEARYGFVSQGAVSYV